MKFTRSTLALGILMLALFFKFEVSASADTIDISTSNPSRWTVTGGNAVNAPAFLYAPLSGISITSNGYGTGIFASGGSIQAFNGFWVGNANFFLPANATNVSLDFSGLAGDDRVVLQLNGTNIGDYFLNGNESIPPLTGAGLMRFAANSMDLPFTFTGTNSRKITSGFEVGAENSLSIVVNNTDLASLTAPTVPLQIPRGDATHAQVTATINYTSMTSAVPEPGTYTLFASLALFGAAFLRRKHAR